MHHRAFLLFALGASCGRPGGPCDEQGLYDECGPGLVCETGRCVCLELSPARQMGEPCRSASDDCEACRAELLCNGAADECQPPAVQANGDPCSIDANCMEPLVCNTATGVEVCETPGIRDQGEPCSSSANCMDGLRCGLPSDHFHCQPPGSEGATCTADEHCQDGLVCNFAFPPGQCQAPGGDGELCVEDSDCQTGLRCDTTASPAVCR